jgi:5-formyltetrahydrofolate cyclo-ligase
MAEPSEEQDVDAAAFRAAQRREKIAARLAMTATEHGQASAIIEHHLAQLLVARVSCSIAFCWPMRNEFDCRPLIMNLLHAGWRACQPVVVATATAMEFRAWRPGSPMTADRYGIPVPATETVAAPDIVLLPLVAFDQQGYRLGYGGGYFDRTLAVLTPRPYAIGVGFELARIDSICPAAHDVRLDAVVTERGIDHVGTDTCVPDNCGR